MNCSQLKEMLDKANIPESSYNLTGQGVLDNRYVLEHRGSSWLVYYYERGKKYEVKEYSSEGSACSYLSEKLLSSAGGNLRPFPLGTVVRLKDGKLKLLIISRGLRVPAKDGKQYYFDYGAVSYPQGLISPNMAYFQQDAVSEILHWGYSDEDDLAILESIHHFLDTHPDIPRGSAGIF